MPVQPVPLYYVPPLYGAPLYGASPYGVPLYAPPAYVPYVRHVPVRAYSSPAVLVPSNAASLSVPQANVLHGVPERAVRHIFADHPPVLRQTAAEHDIMVSH